MLWILSHEAQTAMNFALILLLDCEKITLFGVFIVLTFYNGHSK